ncbi:hypothetical protein BVC80_157g17 [Macleaya cordata]|uniref:Uncharacterized protein n=1 Tax=Macleaya cordata TaxID=56857 RepID=A0A200RBY0_MACCD|nr:hypothetical protein BVC80_157g17 [Macleaya cordata]
MGCCFSKNDDSNRNPPPSFPPPVLDSDISRLKPPLPPQLEEETVKEVLSETPSQKPPSFLKIEEQKTNPILPSFSKIEVEEEEEEKKIEKEAPFFVNQQEVSEVSEICSLSESYSTTTLTEKREDEEGEVRQRVDRSPAKVPRKRSNTGEFGLGTDRRRRSPARRSEPSPGRRNDNAMKFGSNTEVGHTGRRRISAGNNRSWRDPGESSGRRSRSPSTRTETSQGKTGLGLGRSPSSRKTGRSPARIPAISPENGLKLEEFKEGNGLTNESLENPLVSLECFIFL